MSCELTTPTDISELVAQLEQTTCPHSCLGASDKVLHEFAPFRVCRCSVCGLVRLDPRLDEAQLDELYARDYFTGDHATGYDNYEHDARVYEKTFTRRLRLVQRFKSGGTLLDIGCGLGYFMDVARQAGFDVYGLDLSEYAVSRCRDRYPERVHRGLLTRGAFPDNFFDVITMFDLFEHVYHPREFVSLLHEITRADGIVVLTTPNRHSLLSRVSGRKWVSHKVPEHVFYYTPATLRRMLAPLFEIELIRSEGQYCTLEFLAQRIKTLNRPAGAVMLAGVRSLGAKDWAVYVNSGSMTAVLHKANAELKDEQKS